MGKKLATKKNTLLYLLWELKLIDPDDLKNYLRMTIETCNKTLNRWRPY